MEQAAIPMNGPSAAPRTRLRLRQGSSARATWILEEASGGTMITIGADATCDWQIRAAFVPPRACSVLLLNGITYVRPGAEMSVLMNGRPVDNSWTEVEDGARIDVGLARLEIQLEGGLEARPSPARAVYGGAAASLNGAFVEAQPANDSHYGSGAQTAFVTPPPSGLPSGSRHPRGAMYETQAYDGQAFESAYQAHQSEPRTYADLEDSGEFETRRTTERRAPLYEPRYTDEDGVPAVLDDEFKVKGNWWRYALAGVATACAYGGWIVLLDYL